MSRHSTNHHDNRWVCDFSESVPAQQRQGRKEEVWFSSPPLACRANRSRGLSLGGRRTPPPPGLSLDSSSLHPCKGLPQRWACCHGNPGPTTRGWHVNYGYYLMKTVPRTESGVAFLRRVGRTGVSEVKRRRQHNSSQNASDSRAAK